MNSGEFILGAVSSQLKSSSSSVVIDVASGVCIRVSNLFLGAKTVASILPLLFAVVKCGVKGMEFSPVRG
ncbi:hypothetical protein K1719_007803 [Acacia pycnantha]|nr:hypothetical protein K1719_007803 [Acacia pycnantha]